MQRLPLIGVVRGLLRLASDHRWLIPLMVSLGLMAFLFEGLGIYLLIPLMELLLNDGGGASTDNALVGFFVNAANAIAPANQIPLLIAAIIGCILLKGITAVASQSAFALANARIGHGLRQQTFARILGADQHFLDSQRPGALLNTLATETWRLSQGMQALAAMITHGCAVVVFLALMVALSLQLTIATTVGVVAILGFVQWVTSRAKRYGEAAVAANERLAARMSEGLGGLKTIRIFGREDFEKERFAAASADVSKAFFRMDILNTVPGPLLEFLFAALFGVLLLGVRGDALITLLVFLALLQRMQPHAAGLLHARVSLLALSGALDNVFTMIEGASGPANAKARTVLAPAPQREIAFNAVSFSYPNANEAALNDASFTIPAGKTTALVGASGAGKSTVLALVCGLIEPRSGSVRLDQTDLSAVDLAAWRMRIAVVPQEVHLFNTTVRDNIAYGRLDANDADIEAAARSAGADGFIEALPEGYATRVGDRGVRLSGGQRQRIALARALVRDPDLLILDEATNALDTLSERLVRDAIARAAEGRTVLVVAHRMASIAHADQIVVLDRGRVIEQGSPNALRGAGGLFASFVDAERLPA